MTSTRSRGSAAAFRRGWHRGKAWSWQKQLDAIIRFGRPRPEFVAHWTRKIVDERAKVKR